MWYTWLAQGPPSPSCLQADDLPYLLKVLAAKRLDAHHPPSWTANTLNPLFLAA